MRKVYGFPVNYDNTEVIQRFKQEYPNAVEKELHYSFEIPETLRLDFLEMSPLEWAVPSKIKEAARKNPQPSQLFMCKF